jgi:hypothetical protein
MSDTPEAIKARMKVYDRIGNITAYGTVIGLCGMAVCGIWQTPQWAYNVFASAAAAGGIGFVFMLINYSGAKALLKEAAPSQQEGNQG